MNQFKLCNVFVSKISVFMKYTTVKDIIEKLKQYDDNLPVLVFTEQDDALNRSNVYMEIQNIGKIAGKASRNENNVVGFTSTNNPDDKEYVIIEITSDI